MSLIRLLEAAAARRQPAAEPAEEPHADAPPADVAANEPESEAEKEPAVVPMLAVVPLPTDPEPEPEPEPGPRVVHLVLRDPTPRSWNLWQLERLAASKDGERARVEERELLLLHLRQFASAVGVDWPDFVRLVRMAFMADLATVVTWRRARFRGRAE